ncbi:hypothetical protein RIF29_17948 [Crotalaria pallida]|uniref:F-box domain-containing protein n=1 Tax=Crotalaria pallida TaxID=3830 RepID=A0AAN9IF08_CROPI
MAESFDMLSLLPESLIIIIISLLPFKEAVRTSILSKSWSISKLFKKTTNIEFNELFFVKSDQPSHQRKAQRRAFLDFITSWIHDPNNHHESVVDKFCLRLSMDDNSVTSDGDIVQECIAFATQRGVKELELDFSCPNWYEENNDYRPLNILYVPSVFELPKKVYEHTCLQSLKLYKCGFVENGFNNFHALKEVSFGWMEVRVNVINNLPSNCKVLESLSLTRCWDGDAFDITDENGMLRKLVVDWCVYNFRSNTFRVVAPNLKFFKYCRMVNNFDVKGVMEEAYLDLASDWLYNNGSDDVRLYKLMEDLDAVKVLTICSHFLRSHEPTILAFDPMEFWRKNARVHYECLESSLKVVEINGFQGNNNNLLRVLESFIRWGKGLKEMNINIAKDEFDGRNLDTQNHQLAESLLQIPRASTKEMNIISIAKDNGDDDVPGNGRNLAESLVTIPRASRELEITNSAFNIDDITVLQKSD